jgi:uncharacterized protein YgiM (DUF1202 family)
MFRPRRAFRPDRRLGRAALVLLAAAFVFLLPACARRKRLPAIGEAYVAPISLNLRQDFAPRSNASAVVKHGEKLEILARRRRFVKVRTAADAEGWVDSRQLLSPKGMQRLRRLHAWVKKQPSQGRATPLDLLNVHIDPNRYAPTFSQISPDGIAEVIGRSVTRRGPYTPDADPPPQQPPPGPQDIKDDWSLVRLEDGRGGWVISRMMTMNIPESVGMFAQGHRITSIHPIGQVKDRNPKVVSNYLWTTISIPPEKFHFDRFRVSVWNGRTRRFETAHIESNIRGFYPVTVLTPPEASSQRFALSYAVGNGPILERTFALEGRRVRAIGQKPWTPPPSEPDDSDPLLEGDEERQESSWWEKARNRARSWISR